MQNQDEIAQLIYDHYSKRHSLGHLQFEAESMHELMQPELIDPGYMNEGRWQHIAKTYYQLGLLPENFNVETMLYFPDSELDLKKLQTTLYYTAGVLSGVTLFFVILFHFYRLALINEARLKTMFDYTPLSLIVLDNKNQIRSWNVEAEKTFLWRTGDIVGKNITTIIPTEIHPRIEKILADVHNKHSIVCSEIINIKKDGTEILCEWLNAPGVIKSVGNP